MSALDIANVSWALVSIITVLRKRQFAILEPMLWFALSHFIFFSYSEATAEGRVGAMHLVALAGALAGSMTLGTRVTGRRGGGAQAITSKGDERRTAAFIWICVALALIRPLMALGQGLGFQNVLLGMYSGRGYAELGPGMSLFTAVVGRVAPIGIAAGVLVLSERPSRGLKSAWAVLLCVLLITGFASGGRTALAMPLLSTVVSWIWLRRRKEPRIATRARSGVNQLFVYIVVVVPLVAGGAFYQTQFRNSKVETIDDARAAFGEALRDLAASDPDAKEPGAVFSLNSMVFWVSENYGGERPFAYLYSPMAMIVNPIPRAVWHEKPVGWGKRLAEEMFGSPRWATFSTAAGVAGEGWANGGWVGIFVAGMMFGIVAALVRRELRLERSVLRVALALTALYWMLSCWRGDWLSSVNRFVYSAAAALLLWGLLGRVFRTGQSELRWKRHTRGRREEEALWVCSAEPQAGRGRVKRHAANVVGRRRPGVCGGAGGTAVNES